MDGGWSSQQMFTVQHQNAQFQPMLQQQLQQQAVEVPVDERPNLRVSVEPSRVGFSAPNNGAESGVLRIKINNNMQERTTFKVRHSDPGCAIRFPMRHPYGFVEPGQCAYVTVTPRPFDIFGLDADDHLMVHVARAPPGVDNAEELWSRDSPSEPQAHQKRRFRIPIVYSTGNTALPLVIPAPPEEAAKTADDTNKPEEKTDQQKKEKPGASILNVQEVIPKTVKPTTDSMFQ